MRSPPVRQAADTATTSSIDIAPQEGARLPELGLSDEGQQASKRFFFEKKNQKTFGPAVAEGSAAPEPWTKSLLVHFRKNRLA